MEKSIKPQLILIFFSICFSTKIRCDQENSRNPNVVAIWHLNEGGGSIIHDDALHNSTVTNSGTLTGGIWVSSDVIKGMGYDITWTATTGDGIVVSSGTFPQDQTERTWCVSFVPNYNDIYAGLISQGASTDLKVEVFTGVSGARGTGDIKFVQTGGATRVLQSPTYSNMVGKPVFVCIGFDGATGSDMWINGIKVDSSTVTGPTTSGVLTIGTLASVNSQVFDGSIYEVVIYNKRLNDHEERAKYRLFLGKHSRDAN